MSTPRKKTDTILLKSSFSKSYIEAGIDEVGRGCLAGPVVAAAVILPKDFSHDTLRDSKKLATKDREALTVEIKKNAVAWAVAEASQTEIDKINILQASFLAMHRAIRKLKVRPELLLVDGNKFIPCEFIPYHCIVKGDNTYFSIAAASILAKTYRDSLMKKLALEYPEYGWETNVGYPTPKHKLAIKQHGLTQWHRKTFKYN